MNEKQIKEAISFLEQDKEDLLNQINQLDLIIERYLGQLSRLKSHSHISNPPIDTPTGISVVRKNNDLVPDEEFPIDEGIDNQLIFILQKVGRAIRLPELQKLYTTYSGSDRVIKNSARRMKSDEKLVAAKYNNANTLTFWGLPDWIDIVDGKENFSEDRRPSKKELPSGYNTVELT